MVFRVVSPRPASVDHESGTSDWPAEAQSTTLRVLLTGSNLTGARVTSRFPRDHLTVSASGTHLFLDLHVPAHTPPGTYSLRIDNGDGTATARFTIVAPLSPPAASASRPMTSSIS